MGTIADEIINIKVLLRIMRDKSLNDEQKLRRTRTFFWFTSLLEDFINKTNDILTRYENKISTDQEFENMLEEMNQEIDKKQAYDWVMDQFIMELPIPELREKIEAIRASVKMILILMTKKEFKEAEIMQIPLMSKIHELLTVLKKINETMPWPEKVKIYGCDNAINSPCFIDQRDRQKIDDENAIKDAIGFIIDAVQGGLNPSKPEPRHYHGKLYGTVLGKTRRLIFFEKEKGKEIVICIYIDSQTHNVAVNTNQRNIYRKIIDGEVTNANYIKYREIDPETLKDI